MRATIAPAAALVLAALVLPAPAQDVKPESPEVEVGSGLVCDTKQQVERYVQLFNGDPKAAADAVNAEVGRAEACSFGTVAFIRGSELGRVRGNTGEGTQETVEIHEILVLGVETPAGLLEIEPVRWFTIFPVEEFEA